MKADTTLLKKLAQAVAENPSFLDKAKSVVKEKTPPAVSNAVDHMQEVWNELPEEVRSELGGFAKGKAQQQAFRAAVGLAYPKFKLDDVVDDVNTFYNDIVLPTKQEYAGVPGKDYDDTNYKPDFLKNNTRIAQESMLFGPYGYVSPFDVRNKIHINRPPLARAVKQFPDMIGSVVTHEGTHAQNRDAPFLGLGKSHAGVSDVEQQKLDEAYGFDRPMMRKMYGLSVPGFKLDSLAKAEEATVNREYRKAIYDQLREQIGHNPTYDEFKGFVEGLTQDDIENIYRNKVHNGYIDLHRKRNPDKLTPEQSEKLRRSWLEVARNNAQQQGTKTAAYKKAFDSTGQATLAAGLVGALGGGLIGSTGFGDDKKAIKDYYESMGLTPDDPEYAAALKELKKARLKSMLYSALASAGLSSAATLALNARG